MESSRLITRNEEYPRSSNSKEPAITPALSPWPHTHLTYTPKGMREPCLEEWGRTAGRGLADGNRGLRGGTRQPAATQKGGWGYVPQRHPLHPHSYWRIHGQQHRIKEGYLKGPCSFHPTSDPGWTPLNQRARQPVEVTMRATEPGWGRAEHIHRRTCRTLSTPVWFFCQTASALSRHPIAGEKCNFNQSLAASPTPWDDRRVLGICDRNIGRASRSWWLLPFTTLLNR